MLLDVTVRQSKSVNPFIMIEKRSNIALLDNMGATVSEFPGIFCLTLFVSTRYCQSAVKNFPTRQ